MQNNEERVEFSEAMQKLLANFAAQKELAKKTSVPPRENATQASEKSQAGNVDLSEAREATVVDWLERQSGEFGAYTLWTLLKSVAECSEVMADMVDDIGVYTEQIASLNDDERISLKDLLRVASKADFMETYIHEYLDLLSELRATIVLRLGAALDPNCWVDMGEINGTEVGDPDFPFDNEIDDECDDDYDDPPLTEKLTRLLETGLFLARAFLFLGQKWYNLRMKKILAVSGGVDSMAMLSRMLKKFPAEELVVATFDHGARESSAEDAEFVEKKLAEVLSALKKPGKVAFYRSKAELSEGVSEEKARAARYDFLRKIAFREKGEIYTAHHLDDLVETVAINLIRGTGIRGLAPFSSFGVRRPFLDGFLDPREFRLEAFDRRGILKYAAEHKISFRQDPTNTSQDYLRNRVREKTFNLPLSTKLKIYRLWQEQREIVRGIDREVEGLVPEDLRFGREMFREMGEREGLEILRGGLMRAGVSATRPQMREFYQAILDYAPGKKFNLPGDKLVRINKKDFML